MCVCVSYADILVQAQSNQILNFIIGLLSFHINADKEGEMEETPTFETIK